MWGQIHGRHDCRPQHHDLKVEFVESKPLLFPHLMITATHLTMPTVDVLASSHAEIIWKHVKTRENYMHFRHFNLIDRDLIYIYLVECFSFWQQL